MAKLVDALDLGSSPFGGAGSIPAGGTFCAIGRVVRRRSAKPGTLVRFQHGAQCLMKTVNNEMENRMCTSRGYKRY